MQELNANLIKTSFVSCKIPCLKKGQFNVLFGVIHSCKLSSNSITGNDKILDGYDITRETFPTDPTDILT